MPHFTTAKEIVSALGGGSALADKLGCSPAVPSNWLKARVIPRIRWPDLIEIAEEMGVRGIDFETLWAIEKSHTIKSVRDADITRAPVIRQTAKTTPQNASSAPKGPIPDFPL